MSFLRLDSVRAEWGRNRRLRWGILLVAAILVFYLYLASIDWRDGVASNYVERQQYLLKMQSLVGQEEWLDRASDAGRLRAGLDASIPSAATVGLAQAGVQTWARDLSATQGSDIQVQSQAAQSVDDRPEIVRVPMIISGSLPPNKVVELMRQIESNANLTVIDQSMILNRENQTFSLTFVAFFRIEEGGNAPG